LALYCLDDRVVLPHLGLEGVNALQFILHLGELVLVHLFGFEHAVDHVKLFCLLLLEGGVRHQRVGLVQDEVRVQVVREFDVLQVLRGFVARELVVVGQAKATLPHELHVDLDVVDVNLGFEDRVVNLSGIG
jgi:hypothetical protein